MKIHIARWREKTSPSKTQRDPGIIVEKSFQVIECFITDGLGTRGLSREICSAKPFWVSDFLHLLKNARTRLFSSVIYMNPTRVTDDRDSQKVLSCKLIGRTSLTPSIFQSFKAMTSDFYEGLIA
jgi:hypothetical protein